MQHQMDSPPSFDPTREAAGKEFRTWALNSSPPNNILRPKLLRHLEQGTSDDCSCFAPRQLKPCSASAYQLVNSESRASSLNVPALEGSSSGLPQGSLVPSVPLGSRPPRVSTGLPSTIDPIYDLSTPSLPDPPSTRPSSDFLPSGQSTVRPRIESPRAFFTAALGRSKEKRVKRLVGVVEGFSKAKELPDGSHKPFCSGWPRISGSEVGSEAESTPKTFEAEVADRLCRLKQIRQNIRRGDWEASRLWLICLAHEVEHISKWEGIDTYTNRGVDRVSAATKIVEKHLGPVKDDLKKSRNIFQVMKEGGPAAMLVDDGGRPPSIWERDMTMGDITIVYVYKRNILPHLDDLTRSHDPDASYAMKDCFLTYGWRFSGLLSSSTKVMEILRPYLQQKRPHVGGGPGDSESTNKRRRVDRPGASTSRPDHDFPETSLDWFSPGSIDQATSSGIDNTVESMPRSNSSHLISFDARNGTRDLTDAATMGNLDYAFNSSDELTDPATASILGYAVNSPDEFTDPTTASNLGYTNSSGEITDLDTADFLQSTHDQSMDALSNLDYEMDPPVVELLQWTVNGSDALTDPSTDRFLQGAISPTQLYLMDNFIYPSHDQHLPNASTPGCIRSTDDKQSDDSLYTGQS
ncbi:hypothetical protein B0J14DRAFT_567124 [Halenospora varia]|nr:hypothetical protein B0J14DRAFT_567124 [Halenospora varia]